MTTTADKAPKTDKTMKAYRVHAFGPPEAIIAEDIEIPAPGKGEVLIRVHAAGVGPWDGWIRLGNSALPQPLPLTLGSDLSGTVEAIGDGVTQVARGDAVYGVTNPRFIGAYAEYAIAAAGMIARKPASIDHVEAASIPVIAVTARQALFDHARLTAGQTVLIHGAAGNVGAYAVQFARKAGVKVIATASGSDIETVRRLGADIVVDFRSQRFEDFAHEVDAVIDLAGGETQTRSFAVLNRGGRLISAVSQPDQELAKTYGVEALFFLVNVTTKELNEIAAMVDAAELETNVGDVLPLDAAIAAHEMLEGMRPHAKGKIVLKVI
ncbi:NADPH:quinone reductase-like Zn-dependent oxidoreductase [Rhizobium sp. BK529]|uniref:NADP-dependent oxidoreductase n=1 Tax=unclassified Rhizobium TaxID=2613769 RepID=UPI0010F3E0B8|nr:MULTISPECIES: NADP-dependent oxidoreductase [unclassified Rhizobium]MBB3592102.1 NADPH:quinone reductase-like Zn-dependent oxidoreductase [Rhizobium sp. BK529]TCS06524.1 NADPH:quinone reductase-like Zn-dependent oxidoreductase [Rhizobium sp. BK418]